MNRIHVLPLHVANQIAAGEVIERPASVVKELIENAIDAKATRINIEIEKGGMRLIRVHDNGGGIQLEDLTLALCRHATSKIAEAQDLEQIRSLGFRGEALASIASVARISLTSRTDTQDKAYQVVNDEEAKLCTPRPVAHPVGTTVEVRDLFFNIPARRKFLKTENTELNHISEVVARIALSYFEIAFSLTHHDRVIYDFSSCSGLAAQEARIAKICGQAFISQALHIDHEATGLALSGWIGLPTYSRNHPDLQHFYVNQRMIKDKSASHAIKRAYHDVMYHDRYPTFVLYLSIDPDQVDVNAHPAKHEVRFRESRLVYDFIFSRVAHALAAYKPTPMNTPDIPFISSPPARVSYPPRATQQALYFEEAESSVVEEVVAAPEVQTVVLTSTPQHTLGFALGQLHGIYILAENEHGLVIVDMHAAHERILYERLKKEWQMEGIARQTLLLPVTVSATEAEIQCARTYRESLLTLGLDIEEIGPQSLIVRSLPAAIKETNITQLVHDVLSELQTSEMSEKIKHHVEAWLGNFACRCAVRANYKLNHAQMNGILRQMETTSHSSQCNHGRPTWRQFSMSELDKFFLRGR